MDYTHFCPHSTLSHDENTPNAAEQPTTKANTEATAEAVVAEIKTSKPSPTQQPPAKPQAVAAKTGSKGKTKPEQLVPVVAAEEIPKKPSTAPKPPNKTKAVAPKPVVTTTEISPSERVGLTAGVIWHYLADHGATSVAKLIRELPEEEKIIQRSVGWLAQEGKITLDTVNRVEVVSLK